jgi:hypothetical protein
MRLSPLASFLLPCALMAQTAPSPAELIRRADAAEKAQDERGWKYTFREDHTELQIDKAGNATGPPATDTYEHIMLEGAEYRKLVGKTGNRSIRRRRRRWTRTLKRRGPSGESAAF